MHILWSKLIKICKALQLGARRTVSSPHSVSFFEIQVGGNRHIDTWYNSSFPTYCIRDITCAFYIGFATFLPNLVKIGQILLKRQQFIEIQNGVGRHIDFWQLNQFVYNRGA